MWKSFSAALSLLLFASGCAVGVKHDYEQKALELGISTHASVAVGTLDHRPYIVDGNKAPNFVGVSRGGFGNPFDVTTQSGNPLSSDISGSIVASMKEKGVDARVVELKPALSVDQAKLTLQAAGADRSAMITLLEWKADTMMNVGLRYDLTLSVLDKAGMVLTTKQRQGFENLGGSALNPPEVSRVQVPARFRRMMEELFQESDVAKALQQ